VYSSALLCLLGVLSGSNIVSAQKYKPEDPIPPGAQGKVLPLQGKVVEIKGVSLGVAGKAQDLNAALKDLGAKTTQTEIRIELSSDVLFDFDKADLLPKAIPELEKVSTVLKSYPNASCSIEGHTDNKGLKDYNQKLSERRADAVENRLLALGVANRMGIRGGVRRSLWRPTRSPMGAIILKGGRKTAELKLW